MSPLVAKKVRYSAGHDFRRHILHVFEDYVSNVPAGADRTLLFSELLEPRAGPSVSR